MNIGALQPAREHLLRLARGHQRPEGPGDFEPEIGTGGRQVAGNRLTLGASRACQGIDAAAGIDRPLQVQARAVVVGDVGIQDAKRLQWLDNHVRIHVVRTEVAGLRRNRGPARRISRRLGGRRARLTGFELREPGAVLQRQVDRLFERQRILRPRRSAPQQDAQPNADRPLTSHVHISFAAAARCSRFAVRVPGDESMPMNTSSRLALTGRMLVMAIPCRFQRVPKRGLRAGRLGVETHVRALTEHLDVGDTGHGGEEVDRRARRVCDDLEDLATERSLQRPRTINGEHASFVQKNDAAAAFGFVEIRRGHQDGEAAREKLGEQLPELPARDGIDTGRRLVEDEHVRFVHQRARQRQLLLHPTRQAVRAPRPERRQLRHVEQPVACRLVAPDPVQLRKETDVLVDRQVAVKREPLRQVTHRAGDAPMLADRVVPHHPHVP